MKKVMIIMGVGLIVLGGISSGSFAETGRGFYLGVGVGSFPVWIYNSYHVSGEIGFRFSERIGIAADVGYGSISTYYEYESTDEYYPYSSTSTMTYRSTPISGSLIISAPVGENFMGYVGIGLGYYKIKVIEKSTHQNSYNGTSTDTDELESKGLAPHISFGIEFAVSQHTTIFGDLKHIVGQSESERAREDHRSMEKNPLGGSVARIGFRVYF